MSEWMENGKEMDEKWKYIHVRADESKTNGFSK